MIEIIKSMSTITLTILVMIIIVVLFAFLLLYPIAVAITIGVIALIGTSYIIANSIQDGIRLREADRKSYKYRDR